MKLKDKFYVASDRIVNGGVNPQWRKPTLEAAIKHARELLGEDNNVADVKYIVKIVAVVKLEKPPVKVEKVE